MLKMRRSKTLLSLFAVICLQFSACGTSTTTELAPNPEDFESEEEFDIILAIELGLLSLVAYQQRIDCISDGSSAITVPELFTLVKVFFETVDPDSDDVCKDISDQVPIAFIATKGENIYLVFRGTATASEDVLDAEISQVDYTFVDNGGKTELGDTTLYEQINTSIVAEINTLVASGDFSILYITGHSLGAALAVLVVPELADQSATINTIMYSFAGPGVGNPDFVGLYNSSIATSWRVVNVNDVIPKVPPLNLDCPGLDYQHVIEENSITFGTMIEGFPSFSDCSQFTIEATLGIFFAANSDQILINHSMCTYYSTLCDMTADAESCISQSTSLGC